MKDEYYFRTEGLTVGYDGVPLIKDIEIGIRRGEILTLIGPNGAGKTTILKSIIRQLSPICGVVYLDGRKMQEMNGKEIATRMSVVLTERVKPELMSCEDVVATGRYPYTGTFGLLSDQDRRIVKESMELVHITELSDRDFTRISDGQKQRVMLARAICQEPDMIVLDEPTSFLDIKYKLEFLSIIQKMARSRNLSVIMSLHELDLAGRISDQMVCVRGDKIDRCGTPEEIFTKGYIPKLYGMTVGSYDELSGNLELEKVSGEPKVLILSGNGTGTSLFRRLQREGIPFAAGILMENDLDYPSAKALASEVISVRAFAPIREAEQKRAMELVEQCEKVIFTLPEDHFSQMGEYGRILEKLLTFAKETGKYCEASAAF
ncbi:MAG: ABC transporter ATP-binding protein [Fusicatenibacter sp.]|nr:ABC transporter ATP-binding protein [Lachnospiraceae bacterium]MDY2936916.1 ABC transporter ATP-binding protein [Fusicatenibacter sp.]